MPTRKAGPPKERPGEPTRQTPEKSRESGDDRPSDDDLALWRHVTRDTRPLAKRPTAPPARPAAHPSDGTRAKSRDGKAAAPRAGRPGPAAKTPVPPPAPPPPKARDLEKGAVVGVDKRTAGRMKRGKLPVEGRLDLHGLTQNEAERALAAFLARSQARGHRCVLVITGKGGGARQGGEMRETGVLRRMVPIWLNAPANRARILAFDEAQSQHGGGGALYVLMKRVRAD